VRGVYRVRVEQSCCHPARCSYTDSQTGEDMLRVSILTL
jgi:hypothetical protein